MASTLIQRRFFQICYSHFTKSTYHYSKALCVSLPHSVQRFNYSSVTPPSLNKKDYEVTFVKADGQKIKGKAKEGDSLLDVVINNDLDFDGFGACEGTLTCSTCHVILKKEDYDRLPEKPSEEENDMLDLAYGLTDTSRLGCQIQMCKDLDGLTVDLPATVNDQRS